jgi:hypothetical protein
MHTSAMERSVGVPWRGGDESESAPTRLSLKKKRGE